MLRSTRVFLKGRENLRQVCKGTPSKSEAFDYIFKEGLDVLNRQETRAIEDMLKEVQAKLIDRQSMFYFEELKSSEKLKRMRRIAIRAVSDDSLNARAIPESFAVEVPIALVKNDLKATLGSPLPLCGAYYPKLYRAVTRRNAEEELRSIEVAFEFIIRFQVLHEIAHLLLEHSNRDPEESSRNRICKELDADRFAFSYLAAARDILLSFPRSYLPIQSTLPQVSENLIEKPTHPPQVEREEQLLRIRALRDIAFGNFSKRPVSMLDLVTSVSFYDADVYLANSDLIELLKEGSKRCRTSVKE
jgi:hypothetical protein